jgi:hypothetical protein
MRKASGLKSPENQAETTSSSSPDMNGTTLIPLETIIH